MQMLPKMVRVGSNSVPLMTQLMVNTILLVLWRYLNILDAGGILFRNDTI